MNENHTNQQGLTLEEIAVHKQALKIAIAEQQKNVNEAYRQVVAPFSEAKSVSGYIGGRLLNSFTMIESAIWGFRLISRIFRIFRKFRSSSVHSSSSKIFSVRSITQKQPNINNRSHQPHIQLLILRFG